MGRLRKNSFFEQKVFNNKDYYIGAPTSYKAFWNQFIFKNNNPIEIEIGSGKGTFIFQKALKNPNINFVAIDKYPTILSKLINKLENTEKINNLKIIDVDAKILDNVFNENEISKIYLNFLDPWPKKHHEKFRVTNPYFLNIFLKLLSVNGTIEFKTDNIDFFNYSLKVIRELNLNLIFATKNLYNLNNIDNVQTEYEKKWIKKGCKINKLIIWKK